MPLPPAAPGLPKWLRIALKILLGGLAVLITLLVVGLLSFDWIVKRTIQSRVNASGVAEVEIGSLNIGLLRPHLEVRNLKVFGQSQFGGVQILDLPELRVEYDRDAFKAQELKLRLLRIRLNELTLVDGFAGGDTNMFQRLQGYSELIVAYTNRLSEVTNRLDLASAQRIGNATFTGLDRLELTVGRVRFLDMKDPLSEKVATLNINRRVMTNITDLSGMAPLAMELLVRTTLGAKPVNR
ncbi:MAG: hypothetical protein RLZZ582_418 [Verrucomicrobiota bacterium]|jgi:hypothetical protein|nr:hypothetical protein [Verrucomicrobiota bacterium]